jgi:hypothetical protein
VGATDDADTDVEIAIVEALLLLVIFIPDPAVNNHSFFKLEFKDNTT